MNESAENTSPLTPAKAMSTLIDRISELSPEKRALLMKKLRQTTPDRITPRPEQNVWPLSWAQQRLWFLNQLEPHSPLYNISAALRLQGKLSVPALEAALNEIIRRHEILRASFVTERGWPVERIAPELKLKLAPEDLRHLPAEQREAEIQRLATEEARRPFELSQGPLVRVRILQTGEAEHVLLLTMHHIVSDGWSTGVLVSEIITLYDAFTQHRPSPLAPLDIQYADYAHWQREWLQGETRQQQLDYWKEKLGGSVPALNLPADRPRPAVQTFHGAHYRFRLPSPLAATVSRFSREENATPFVTLLATFYALLHRYTAQEDICIGSPVASRNRAEIEGLIGFFVNTLVLRTDLSGAPSFRELLRRVRDTTLDAQAHQDLPFEMLVEELQPQRDLSRTPFFQTAFLFQHSPLQALHLPGLQASLINTDPGTAKFDLMLMLEESQGELTGDFEYNTDLFEAATIERMAGHFERLLGSLLEHPDQSIATLPLLTEAEERQLIEWNQTATNYPREASIQQLFEAQVARTPDAVAVVYDAQHLTYRELNERANRLAHYLRKQGVGPESLVGIYAERSLEMIVGILGILKAGGAYLPLDLMYPPERIAFMLADAQASVLLTQENLKAQISDLRAELHLVSLDSDWPLIAQESDENPEHRTTGENLAYVIYTSGSTGTPKGVAVPQRAINRLVFNTNYIAFKSSDRIAQASNASFDAATFEIWGALLHGGRLIGISKETALSPKRLAAQLREDGITTLFLTTALFNQLVREIPDIFSGLEHLLFGGEACDPQAVRLALEAGAPRRLLHVYGPTESTTYASWYLIKEVLPGATTVPIGRPLSNTTLCLLDRQRNPVPVGVPGELYIGGDGLARGYLNRPELTAEKFIEWAGGSSNQQRLYRTGDLARFLPDGNIEFLGRLDEQVKIRGFRIEPGEIEAVLTAHPAVREVLVLAREDEPGDKRLIAYLVPAAEVGVSELREYLKERLPEYMVPSAFVLMEQFPLNPNGKVDRKALPAPDGSRSVSEGYVAPRTPLEELVAGMWRELLKVERVGIYDNFFELGGDSLKAAVFMNRLQEEHGINAHLRTLFFVPNVAGLATYCHEYFPELAARLGAARVETAEQPEFEKHVAAETRRLDESDIAEMRRIITPLPPRSQRVPGKNPRAIFLLSPPRSGSTLLRVMLEGHPQLFSPPELELLSFNTLAERRAAFAREYQMVLEGTIRALMEIHGCDADTATRMMEEYEQQNLTTKEFYRLLQEGIGDRILVDKTPVYALDPAMLRRAEEDFDEPLYIHLVRHPYATIYSFIEAKLYEYFFRYPHSFSPRELSELMWIVSHQNILEFFSDIPAQRQHRVRYEDLVTDPRRTIEGMCEFLGIWFHPDMVEPYKGRRMTDAVRPTSQMVGDLKFYLRREIDATASERWRRHHREDFLSEAGWQLAGELGYERETAALQVSVSVAETTEQTPELKPVPRDGHLPLSFSQQRLWFLDQLEPGSPFYNVPAAVRFKGRLNVPVLERSLREVIRRHESLRTSFATVEGKPVLRIAAEVSPDLTVTDLRGLPETERESQLAKLARAEAQQPFDLAHGPLLRCRLLQLADDEQVALFTMHHIISDGWSVEVLISELGALYDAFLNNRPSPLAPLTVQYADYAVWQREWLQGERLQAQLDYWKRVLRDVPSLLELPTDRPRPPVQTHRGARVPFTISQELTRALRQLSRQEGATLFMTLLAAFQILLARYARQEDICIGTPVANRHRHEISGLIGFFVNTIALRGDLSGNPTFRELLHRNREMATGAYAHQEVPFEMVVDALQPERSLDRSPLFQVLMSLNRAMLPQLKLTGLRISPVNIDSETAKFDLTLAMVEREDGLRGAFEYNTDLFDAATIERMVSHFETLLAGIVADPAQRIAGLPLMNEAEQRRVLSEWNQTAADFPAQPVSRLFEAQAARTPDSIAVVFENRRLTYRELNERASRLARYLQRQGIGPGSIVAICCERSFEMVIAILGVMKAGAAYLPIDAAHPAERIAFMLADSATPVLLTQSHLRSRISDLRSEIHLVCLDADWPLIAGESVDNLAESATPDNLAYVIYTSGSTGQPKGTLIEHRGLTNLITYLIGRWRLEADSRVLQFASPGFDASVTEIFSPLLCGARLVLAGRETLLSPHELIELLRREGITTVTLPPSLLAVLPSDDLPSLQTVISAGEACPREVAARWAQGRRLLNGYGPTEATVGVTYYDVPARLPARQPVPIGSPIANTQIRILDAQLRPVPIGVPGELCVSGAGLARGYLNRPELTAEKFIEWAGGSSNRQRLYRTGDLARWLADGNIEFLGRIDEQVKLRGFRIEPGEIEAVLRRHPAITDAVVSAREDEPGRKRLVAYLVAEPETAPAGSELRSFLKDRLPEYMIPSAFVRLDALPLNANGKVDRRCLPAPETGRLETAGELVAPQTGAERTLAEIWQQLLGLKEVGVSDNFFELGGDSILSIQVIARARSAGLHLTPRQFFQHPTIAGLAAVAGTITPVDAEQGTVTGEMPLTPIQRWFFAQEFTDAHHWNQAVMLELSERPEADRLAAVLKELLAQHDALRLRCTRTEAGWRQFNAGADEPVPFEWIDLSALTDAELRGAIEARAAQLQASLNFTTGPLLRVAYFDCGAARRGRLLLVIHHLAIDGVSWRVLLEDFQTAYQQLSTGNPVQLPPKTTSFKAWAQKLTEYAQSDAARAEFTYWQSLAEGHVAPLPVDYAEGENTQARAQTAAISLSEEETRALLQEVPAAYGTEISEVLLAALARTFARWTGSRELLVDLEGHGREEIIAGVDLTRTVGWFTSLYPMRLRLPVNDAPGEALKAVKEQLRRVPNRGIGFGILRWLSRDEAIKQSLRALPQPEVGFNYLGQVDQTLRGDSPFRPARESVGASQSARSERPHRIEINGSITGGRLQLGWSYSAAQYRPATIERLASDYLARLRELIAHCQHAESGGYLPSDFPDVALNQAELDAILEEIG
jgi:amino acid adenylation domain-containing protein/non-ribosomal peptide synthase protein (TIGR01720 family)